MPLTLIQPNPYLYNCFYWVFCLSKETTTIIISEQWWVDKSQDNGVSYFSHWCNKTPGKGNVKNLFWFTVWGCRPSAGKVEKGGWPEQEVAGHLGSAFRWPRAIRKSCCKALVPMPAPDAWLPSNQHHQPQLFNQARSLWETFHIPTTASTRHACTYMWFLQVTKPLVFLHIQW